MPIRVLYTPAHIPKTKEIWSRKSPVPMPTTSPNTPLSDPRMTFYLCYLEELEEMNVQLLAELELSSCDNLAPQNSPRPNAEYSLEDHPEDWMIWDTI